VTGPVIEPTSDVDLLAAIHVETVNVAYDGWFPPGAVPPTVEEHRETWAGRLSDPTATAFIARLGEHPVGSVLVRADPDMQRTGQIVGLHVRPTCWRRGVGAALHDHALDGLRRAGYRQAALWVIAANYRARALYDSRGWTLVPGVEHPAYGIIEIRYRRSLEDG
jgi:ribosomal protein S18 acetylase RimI-like enzyme